MPLGSLTTVITADLRQLEAKLKEAKRLTQDYVRDVQKISTVQIGGTSRGGGGGGTSGGIAASPAVQAGLNDLRQQRVFQTELQRQETQINRERTADQRRRAVEQRQLSQERLRQDADERRATFANTQTALRSQRYLDSLKAADQRKNDAEQRKRDTENRRQEETNKRAGRVFTPSPELQNLENRNRQRDKFRKESERNENERRREEEAEKRRRAQEQRRAEQEQKRQEEPLRRRARLVEQADVLLGKDKAVETTRRLRQEATQTTGVFGDMAKTIGGQVNKALETSFRIANELKLIVGFGVLGGIVGIAAEGIKLNKDFDQFRITMGATVALTHDVVDSMGRIVEGPQKLNFILGQTPRFFQEIRKIAANTLLEQNELVQTISENIGLAAGAGFKINTQQQRQQTFGVLANIAQLAKAIGLPGGQRQLTQEVRALLQGERLQGATIAKILGFTSGTEIARLQGQRSTQGNANKFIDELTTRLKAAQPFLDQFKNSFAGLATTLISQGKEFLRLSFLPVFQRIVEVMKRLRDQFGDEAIARGAQRIGEALANITEAIIRIGSSSGARLLFQLFELLAANADKLLALFLAMKGLGAISALAGLRGGKGGGAAGVGGLLAGASVGAGARTAGGLLRGAAGLIGTEGLLALGLPAAMVGGGLLTAGGAGALGLGVGLGTGAQRAGTALGARFPGSKQGGFFAGPQLAGLPGELGEAAAGDPIRQLIEFQLKGERRRLDRLREESRAPAFFRTPQAIESGIAASQKRINDLQKRGHLLGQLELQRIANKERTDETVKERLEARKAMAEAKQDREGQLKIQLALDRFNIEQTIKDRAAAEKQQAAATARFLREINELRQDEYLKTREQFATLTEDEIGQIRIRAEKDISELKRRNVAASDFARLRGAILAKAARDESIQRLDQRDKQLGVQEATAKSFGQSIRAQAIATAQTGDATIKQRLRGEITEKEFVQRIRSLNFEYQQGLRKQREETHNKGVDLLRKFADESKRQVDIQKNYKREQVELEERLAKRQKALVKERVDAERGLTDALRSAKQARENLELGGATRAERDAFRKFTSTRQEETRSLISGQPGQETLSQFSAADRTIRAQLQERFSHEVRQQFGDLQGGQQLLLTTQKVDDTIRELSDTIVGPDGLNKVLERLKELGVNVTPSQRRELAGFSVRSTIARQTRETVEEVRAAEGEQRTAADAQREVDTARDQLEQTKKEQAKFPAEADRERTELNDKFKQEVRDNTIELFRLGQEVKNFRQEVSRAGIAIDQTLLAAINRLSPLIGLGPAATGKAIGSAAALSVPGAAPFIGPLIPEGLQGGITERVKGFQQEFGRSAPAFLPSEFGGPLTGLGKLQQEAMATGNVNVGGQVDDVIGKLFQSPNEQTVTSIPGVDLRGIAVSPETAKILQKSMGATTAAERSEAASNPSYHLNIGQLGADTKELIDQLGEKLKRDARRTP